MFIMFISEFYFIKFNTETLMYITNGIVALFCVVAEYIAVPKTMLIIVIV